ncbi:MAG: glycerol-3-phosphate 1-O-acyltransferase PlsY [Candidatus Omnitrophota bacterium]|nr:glycerol-3-phosphate 1-O-acyltransferase PlsY [Candidatus Omnitrophota bacterium]
MNSVSAFILSFIASYLIGSLPTSFVLTKILKGVDIREVGSGNAGATNVLRAAGKIPALITLIVDVMKGVFVVTALAGFFYSFLSELDYDFYRSVLGLAAVCGHIWPVFTGFRGGKGVATTLGVGIGIAPALLIPVICIWLIIFFITNYVSLASIAALVFFPAIAAIFNYHVYTVIFSVLICTVVIYKHKENIKRLVRGEENKTVIFKTGKK